MASIETSGWPLVFRSRSTRDFAEPPSSPGEVHVQVAARALEGMQKEALVRTGSGRPWRMVSDEGPYLEGTDLAPFPLAFFTAGMQFSSISEIVRLSSREKLPLKAVRVQQDNYYSMEGSFLRGDAVGGARPAEIRIELEGDAPPETLAQLADRAFADFPAHAVMRDRLENGFSLHLNGEPVPLDRLRPCTEASPNPASMFETLEPEGDLPDAIEKLSTAKVVHGVEGGAGSSLLPEQKRTLHVHGEARLIDGLAMQTTIQLFKPIGSTFRFRSDETKEAGGQDIAPSPLAYLSAGVAFCYLTQLGRYARIAKRRLDAYSVYQHSVFRGRDAGPFDTHVFLDGPLGVDEARGLVVTGERTCFLHASMRGRYPAVRRL